MVIIGERVAIKSYHNTSYMINLNMKKRHGVSRHFGSAGVGHAAMEAYDIGRKSLGLCIAKVGASPV